MTQEHKGPEARRTYINERLKESSQRVRAHVAELQPDRIIFTGDSSVISQAIARASGILEEGSAFSIIPHFNFYYGSEEELTAMLIRNLADVSPTEKIVVIDEFIDSGVKAAALGNSLRGLGFQSVDFVALSGSNESDGSMFVASNDRTLYDFLVLGAGLMSHVQDTLDNPNTGMEVKLEIQAKARKFLVDIIRAVR